VKHTNLYKGPPSEKLRVLWMASWPSALWLAKHNTHWNCAGKFSIHIYHKLHYTSCHHIITETRFLLVYLRYSSRETAIEILADANR